MGSECGGDRGSSPPSPVENTNLLNSQSKGTKIGQKIGIKHPHHPHPPIPPSHPRANNIIHRNPLPQEKQNYPSKPRPQGKFLDPRRIENYVNCMHKSSSNIRETWLMSHTTLYPCSLAVHCASKSDLNLSVAFISLNELTSFNFKLKLTH